MFSDLHSNDPKVIFFCFFLETCSEMCLFWTVTCCIKGWGLSQSICVQDSAGKKHAGGFFIWKMSIPVSHKREKIFCLVIGMLLWPSFDLFMLWQNKSLHYGLFAVCTVNSISLCKLLWVTFFMVNKQTMVQCFQDFISVYSTITSVHFFVCRVHCGLAEITFISAEIRLKRQKHLGL